MGLYCIISQLKRDTGRKSRFLHTPPAFDTTVRENITVRFGTKKSSRIVCGLPDGEKKSEDMFARFDTIHERDRYQTDRRTDRQMNTA